MIGRRVRALHSFRAITSASVKTPQGKAAKKWP